MKTEKETSKTKKNEKSVKTEKETKKTDEKAKKTKNHEEKRKRKNPEENRTEPFSNQPTEQGERTSELDQTKEKNRWKRAGSAATALGQQLQQDETNTRVKRDVVATCW